MHFKDHLVISDLSSGQSVVFNERTFKTLIKGILIRYANQSEVDAQRLIDAWPYFSKPIRTLDDALFFSHETEYHWAMMIANGDQYWNSGIAPNLPADYEAWEKQYIQANELSVTSFEW